MIKLTNKIIWWKAICIFMYLNVAYYYDRRGNNNIIKNDSAFIFSSTKKMRILGQISLLLFIVHFFFSIINSRNF